MVGEWERGRVASELELGRVVVDRGGGGLDLEGVGGD